MTSLTRREAMAVLLAAVSQRFLARAAPSALFEETPLLELDPGVSLHRALSHEEIADLISHALLKAAELMGQILIEDFYSETFASA